jgi:hypothetical protein
MPESTSTSESTPTSTSTSITNWIDKNPGYSTIIFLFIIGAIVIIPIVISETNSSKKRDDIANSLSSININNKNNKEETITLEINENNKKEINNILKVNTIKLINSKISLYKEIDYTGEPEVYSHDPSKGTPNFAKQFDNNNNKFKSFIIENNKKD